jgi:L-malate glycosyltransferase
MKVLIVVPSLANKGPVRVAQEIANALIRSSIPCEVWYFDPIEELRFNCKTRRINFFGEFDTSDFDVIHSHGIRPDAWVAKMRLLRDRTGCMSTIHNYVDLDLKFQYNWVVALIFSRVWRFLWSFHERLIVLSEDARNYYQNNFPQDKLLVIGNGLTDQTPSALADNEKILISKLKKDHFIFGTCAQVTERKGLEQIISALTRNTDCAFVLIGDGPELTNLQGLAESVGVSDRCIFLGFRHNARDFLPYFDAVALPSRSEGFPLSFIEAAAASRPVLLSDIPVFREIAPPGTAIFFKLDSTSSLDDAILNLRKSRIELKREIRTLYIERFTIELMASKYISCYRNLQQCNLK